MYRLTNTFEQLCLTVESNARDFAYIFYWYTRIASYTLYNSLHNI